MKKGAVWAFHVVGLASLVAAALLAIVNFGAIILFGYVKAVEPNLPVLYTEFGFAMFAGLYAALTVHRWIVENVRPDRRPR